MKNNRKFSFSILAITAFMCTACSLTGPSREVQEYFSELPYQDSFKIMQLSDMHFSSYDNLKEDFDFLDLLIEEAKPNLIIITGDSFTFASKDTVHSVLNFFEKKDIPWTYTFGNHDEQVYGSSTYISEYLNSLDNCLYRYYEDGLTGQGNNVINLVKDGKTMYQIFVVDSNAYTYQNYAGYDYVHEDQIGWYKSAIERVNKERFSASWKIGDETINSLIFQHIPIPEYADALVAYAANPSIGTGWNREKCSPPKYNSGFFDAIKEYNSSKAMFAGHDHINNFDVLYEGVHLVYGAKSTDNMYHDDDMLGYRLITIESENSFSTSVFYHAYGETL